MRAEVVLVSPPVSCSPRGSCPARPRARAPGRPHLYPVIRAQVLPHIIRLRHTDTQYTSSHHDRYSDHPGLPLSSHPRPNFQQAPSGSHLQPCLSFKIPLLRLVQYLRPPQRIHQSTYQNQEMIQASMESRLFQSLPAYPLILMPQNPCQKMFPVLKSVKAQLMNSLSM